MVLTRKRAKQGQERTPGDGSSHSAKSQRPPQGLRATFTLHENEATFDLKQTVSSSVDQVSEASFQAAIAQLEPSESVSVSVNMTAQTATAVIKLQKDLAFKLPLIADLSNAIGGSSTNTAFQPPGTVWAFAACVLMLADECDSVCEKILGNEALNPLSSSLASQCLEVLHALQQKEPSSLQVAEFLQADELLKYITTWLPCCFRSCTLSNTKNQHCCCERVDQRLYLECVKISFCYDSDPYEDDRGDDINELHKAKVLHLAKVVKSLPERFLMPLLAGVSFATAACSHPVALTSWLQASPASLQVDKSQLVAAPCGKVGCTGRPLAFFQALAKGTTLLQPHSLPLQALAIDDMEMVPDLAIINQALRTLSRCASISRLALIAQFTTPEKVQLDYDLYALEDMNTMGAYCMLRALAGFSLKRLMLPCPLWRELIGDGHDVVNRCLGKNSGLIIREDNGALLGMVVEGRVSSFAIPKAHSRLGSVCGRCGYLCERCMNC